MDSDTKEGRTEEESVSVQATVNQKVSNALLSKWERAAQLAKRLIEEHNIPEDQVETFLKMFEVAYFRGAIDVSEINLTEYFPRESKVH